MFLRGIRNFIHRCIVFGVSLFLYEPPKMRSLKRMENQLVRYKPDGAEWALIYFHGNACMASEVVWLGLKEVFDDRVAYYSPEYPGYGNVLPIPTTEEELFESAEIAWSTALVDGFPPDKIVIYGQSLGGAPAVYLASTRTCGGLVLHAAFASVFTILGAYAGKVMRRIGLDVFDNASRMRNVKCRVGFIHSPDDWLIRFHPNVGANTENLPADIRWHTWKVRGGHNACPSPWTTRAVLKWVRDDESY